MNKRLVAFLCCLATVISSFALSLAGKTFKTDMTEEYGFTGTLKFTSASRGSLTLKPKGQKASTLTFRYEISGEVINIYPSNGGMDYFYMDTAGYYGDGCLYTLDPYGNVFMIFKPAASSPAQKSSGSKKRR